MLKLSKTNTITRPVKVRLPTDNPNAFNEGTINVQFKIKAKDEVVDLGDRGLSDRQYIDELVVGVEGLGDDQGNPITGEAAIKEVNDGPWSTYLQAAIIGEYFDHFGDARVKNSKTSRGR